MKVGRRQFLGGSAGLTFCCVLRAAPARGAGFEGRPAPANPARCVELNAYVNIAPSGITRIYSPSAEMGQGTLTALPLIVAEELDADWDDVRVELSPPVGKAYGDPLFLNMIVTAASRSVTAYFDRLRSFGAQARAVLLLNAAQRWNIPVAELSTEPSVVIHARSGRRLKYGEIARFGKMPVHPPEVPPEALKPPGQFRLIGKSVPRRDLPEKVVGATEYSIDVELPGMLYAAVARSPMPGAILKSVEETRARRVPGVIDLLRTDRQVAAVATNYYAALRARNELSIEWNTSGAAGDFDSDQSLESDRILARDIGARGVVWDQEGDAEARLKIAARVFAREYLSDFTYSAGIEPLNSIVSVSQDGASAEVWAGTQATQYTIDKVARVTGIDPGRIKLHWMLLGGGFGRRALYDMDFIEDAAWISNTLRKPIKVIWSREDDLHNGYFRPQSAQYIRAAIGSSGRIEAWHHRVACEDPMRLREPLLYAAWKGAPVIGMTGTEQRSFSGATARFGYDLPDRLVEYVPVVTGMRVYAVRGTGGTGGLFAIESFIDELAADLGKDPLALRMQLLERSPRARTVLEHVARMADWQAPRADTALGLAYSHYEDGLLACVVEASVDRTTGVVRAHRCWAAVDVGIPIQPDGIRAQVEGGLNFGLSIALGERITFKRGRVQQSNFDDYPIMRMSQAPAMQVEVLASEEPPKGIGENGATLGPAALANAFARLTGKRFRHIPFTPERVRQVLVGT